MATARQERLQSFGEEIANSMSHGLGLVAAVAACPILVAAAVQRGDTGNVVGASVFATTLVLLYLASTLFHALPHNRAKRVFRVLDHSAIYLLIAGSYTPFALGVLRGTWGWTLFGLQWGLAVLGIVLKSVGGVHYTRFSTGIYLAMGWLILIAVGPLMSRMSAEGVFWIAVGGFAYTAGVTFFTLDRFRYFHFAWHLCVIAGSICHFFAVLWYAI